MSNHWQTPIALAIVLLALATLVRWTVSKKKKPGCSGCPTDKFKAGLKH